MQRSVGPVTGTCHFRPRSLAFVAPVRPIGRPVLPAHVRHVHAHAAVQQTDRVAPAPESSTQAVVQPSPSNSPAAPSLKEKVSGFIKSTAKAAAILGVAVALVSGLAFGV